MLQSGFFDLEDKFKKLDEKDPLIKLTQLIDWEMFRSTLEKVREKERKSNAGRKPYDVVLMFKVLILQHLYNLSDDETEYQISPSIRCTSSAKKGKPPGMIRSLQYFFHIPSIGGLLLLHWCQSMAQHSYLTFFYAVNRPPSIC